MDTKAFLQHVLPETGPYCICHKNPKPYGYTQLPAADIDEAVAIARQFDREGRETFFAVGALVKAQSFDPKLNRGEGGFRTFRTGENIRALRAYIIDIDADGRQYETVDEALAALKEFCGRVGLPRPTVITSGGGLHVYWTLTEEVPPLEWKSYGERLKELASANGLKFDPGRTADAASVLRVVGTHNYKYDPARIVAVRYESWSHPPAQIHQILDGGSKAPTKLVLPSQGAPLALPDNTKREVEYEKTELSLKLVYDECQQFRDVADNQQGQPEPRWYMAIQLAAHCHRGREAAHAISNQDSRYTEAYTNEKVDQALRYGPANCASWEKYDRDTGRPNGCASCKHYGKLTSVAQVARYYPKAPTPPAPQALANAEPLILHKFIEPPMPFRRTTKGIVIKMENKSGVEEDRVIVPYDMYPVKLRFNEATKLEEDVQWYINLPQRGWTLIDFPQGIPQMQLHSIMAKRGVHFDARYGPQVGHFMTAYMRSLQAAIKTEQAFAKYGWRTEGFALGSVLYKNDGTQESHSASMELIAATHDGIQIHGTLDAWKEAVAFYKRPGMESYRVYLYSSFASVLYHMSGHKAVSVCATGLPGIGKSTIMDAGASVWGDPGRLVRRGGKHGITRAALEIVANGLHSLPLMLDEISHSDPKEMAEFIFNYTAGSGKARAKATGGVRTDTATWGNILHVNTNADEYDRFQLTNRDNAAHMLRLVQIHFRRVPGITKEEADEVRRKILNNYGHAGPIFAAAIAAHYDKLQKRLEHYDKLATNATNATSEERFWCAWAASVRLAAEIAEAIGLLEGFPIMGDVAWIYTLIKDLRGEVTAKLPSASDIISEFLDASIDGTLRLGTKTSNISNIMHEPRGTLIVRHDMDSGECVIAVKAFHEYCTKQQLNYTRIVDELLKQKIVKFASTPRTLGAGTAWAAGRVRAIVLDMNLVAGKPALVVSNPAPAQAPVSAKAGP